MRANFGYNVNTNAQSTVQHHIPIIDAFDRKLTPQSKIMFDKENIFGNTPLVFAIKSQLLKSAITLITKGFFDLERSDEYTHLTPLHHSAHIKDEQFLSFISETFEPKIDSKDYQGNTALHYACWHRNIKFAQNLIDKGASLKSQNNEGHTPLHIACASNNPKFDHSSKLEECLLDRGADIDALNNEGETPLMMLFKLDCEDEIITVGNKFDPITTLMVLLNGKADVNSRSKSKKTPLHYACIRGSTISALTLINNGAECNAKDYSETTPYAYAIKN
jgi:ankyrin repeat protein